MAKHDEMERRLAELERAVRMRDELLAVLAHELRAPLHAILGWSEILLARAGEAPAAAAPPMPASGHVAVLADTRPGLEAIGRNARAQAQLIEDAVEINRLFSGKQRLEVQATSVARVVAAAIDAVHAAAHAKELTFAPLVEPAPTQCEADPQRLQQIVVRLLREAIKLSPVRGQLTLSAKRVDDQVELSIATSGPGAQSASGAVSIARALAELQGGSVGIEGNRFALRLPTTGGEPVRAPAAIEPRRGAPSVRSSVVLDGLKVLVIDDDSDARDMVQAILLDARANAFTAASADEGLTLLRDFKPDIIISDIGMAARDGYQFIRLVRMMPTSEGGRTPALALTAHVQTEDRTRALLAGYQEHISKPVEAHQLLSAVHRLTRPTRSPD